MKVSGYALAMGAALSLAAGWSLASSFGRDAELSALDEKIEALTSSVQRDREASQRARSERVARAELREPERSTMQNEAAAAAKPAGLFEGGAPGREVAASSGEGAQSSAALSLERVGEHLEEEFLSAPEHDAPWAQEARSVASAKLRDLLPQSSQLRSVECRASLCRIETVHADLAAYQQFVQRALLDSATHLWNGGAFSRVVDQGASSGGPLATVAYFAREGQGLPLSSLTGASPH